MLLPASYFQNNDVVLLAQELIGKILYTKFHGNTCAAIITETEAYAGLADKASHAYNRKYTKRTRTLYESGGIAYIYLIYGIHSLFNIVTNVKDIPHAVLIRGGFPLLGADQMKIRNGGHELTRQSLIGPGKLSKLMGIHYSQDGIALGKSKEGDAIWIEDQNWSKDLLSNMVITSRIGIDYAEEDALLPYRFLIPKSKYHLLESFKTDYKTSQ